MKSCWTHYVSKVSFSPEHFLRMDFTFPEAERASLLLTLLYFDLQGDRKEIEKGTYIWTSSLTCSDPTRDATTAEYMLAR